MSLASDGWGGDWENGRGKKISWGKILMKVRDDLRAEMEAEKSRARRNA
ncbi:MAG: hypothetical protein J6K20_04625 [Thermoguttaceae bacterium]|nr:hypothetical protein [Thermoguttaceae bacterium]